VNIEHQIRQLLHGISGLTQSIERLTSGKQKPVRLWLLTIGHDEPMKGKHMLVKLTKPLAPGFRRAITITPDEAVDRREDGSYCTPSTVDGDSTGTVLPSSTATKIDGFINGDGSLGDKTVRFTCDGHVGEGDVPVTVDVGYTVASPDATELKVVETGAPDEPIPGATPPGLVK
jgi:hypothetical protein